MRVLWLLGTITLGLIRSTFAQTAQPSTPETSPSPPQDQPTLQDRTAPVARILDPERFAGAEDGDEIVVQLKYGDASIADGMIAQLWPGGVRLPLGQVATAFEFAIDVDPTLGRADGWFVNSNRTFQLYASSNIVHIAGREINVRPGAIAVTPDDIYVDVREMSEWFPINFEVSLQALQVRTAGREPLPMEQRAAREAARAQLFARFGAEEATDALRIRLPYRLLSSPFFGVRNRYEWSNNAGDSYDYDINASADVAWMSARVALSGNDEDSLLRARATLGREDPYGRLPGGLTRFEIGDTYTPATPAVANSLGGRGVTISNAPLIQADLFDRTDLRGPLPAGYDVELYRNGVLIGSQPSRGDGQYEFLDVPLDYGDNELRLVFYGPRGETFQQVRALRVGNDFLAPGRWQFQLSALEQGVGVVETAESLSAPSAGDGQVRAVARADYGLGQRLTLSSTLAAIPINDSYSETLASLGARVGLGRSTLNLDAITDSTGAFAYRGGIAGRYADVSVGLDYVSFEDDFRSELSVRDGADASNLANVRISFSAPFGYTRVPVDFSFDRQENRDGTLELDGALRTTLPLPGRMLLSNTLTYRQSAGVDHFAGDVDLNIGWRDWLLRGSYSYEAEEDDPRGRAFSLQLDRRFMDDASLRLSTTREFDGGTQSSAALTWRLNVAEIGFGASYDDENDETQAFLTLGFGFGRDHYGRRWVMSGDNLADLGMTRPIVYLDHNANGRRDDGDEPLEGVRIGAGTGEDVRTESDGEGLLTRLDPGRPVVVQLDQETLPDPYMLPAVNAVEIVPRAGRVQVIEFPVVQTGSIEGMTLFSAENGERPVGNVRLELIDAAGVVVAATASEFDGFYAFERVRPGTYQVRLEPERARQLNISTTHLASLTITPDGSVQRGINLVLHRESAPATRLARAAPTPVRAPAIELWSPAPSANAPTVVPTAPVQTAALRPPAAEPPASSVAGSVIPVSAATETTGTLVFANGSRMIGVPGVRLNVSNSIATVVATTVTGADGAFTISGLAPGRYTLSADTRALAARSLRMAPADFVVEASGASIALGNVNVTELAADTDASVATADIAPAYRPLALVEVAPLLIPSQTSPLVSGTHDLPSEVDVAESPEAADAIAEDALWTPAASTAPSNGATLRGSVRLLAQESVLGLRNIIVRIFSDDGALSMSHQTDISGNFRFTNLPPGRYRVLVDRLDLASRGAQLEQDARVEVEDNAIVDLQPFVANLYSTSPNPRS